MPRKLSYEKVRKDIEDIGYKLLSTEYKGNSKRLSVECAAGHVYDTTYGVLCGNRHRRCPYCYGNVKKTLEEVYKLFESHNINLLAMEYNGNKGLLDVKCKICGYNFKASVWSVRRGIGCKKCSSLKYDEQHVISKLETVGYKLMTPYRNTHGKIDVMCDVGHIYETTFALFSTVGTRCSFCSGNHKLSIEDIKKTAENRGWTLLTDVYMNNSAFVDLLCSEGHGISMTVGNFRAGKGCRYCSTVKKWSKPEKEILKFVQDMHTGTVIENDRTQILHEMTMKFLELDIWLPELNKAIEYNGRYYHSGEYKKYLDAYKANKCINRGIDLLVIEEADWLANKNQCLLDIEDHINGVMYE